MRPLSGRAIELLTLIRDGTDKDWTTGELRSYWIPPRNGYGTAFVFGAGDASSLHGLQRRGLIKTPRGSNIPYAYEITEDGLLALQDHEARQI